MNGKDLFVGMGHISEKYYEEAGREFSVRRPASRMLVIAAIITVLVLMMGCAVVSLLYISDLQIGERVFTAQEEVHQQVLTLSGIKGTPEYQAAKEWYDFLQEYDPNGDIQESVIYAGKKPSWNREYDAYNVFSEEMVEKLDQLSEKYDLRLLGEMQRYHAPGTMFRAVGVDNLLLPDSGVNMIFQNGAHYESGAFSCVFDLDMPGEGWPSFVMGRYVYSPKGSLDPQFLVLGSDTEVSEWNYQTASGTDVLLISEGEAYGSVIFCNRGDASIAVVLSTMRKLAEDNTSLTEKQLEQIADAFDFEATFGTPVASNQAAEWDYTVNYAVSDGQTTFIDLTVTVPEKVTADVAPGSWNVKINGSGAVLRRQDLMTEGLDGNQIRLNLQCSAYEEAPFRDGDIWTLNIEDFVSISFSELGQISAPLVDGVWHADIPVSVNGDFRELMTAPVTAEMTTDWGYDGTEQRREITFTSLTLYPYTAILRNSGDVHPFVYSLVITLEDGREVYLGSSGVYNGRNMLLTSEEIPIDQVQSAKLDDGTVL